MKYIYTVKPLKEAIKIAVENDDLFIDELEGTVSIYCISLLNWPAGEKVKTAKRPEGSIKIVGWWVPLVYFTEEEKTETEETPEFIKNLYTAIKADCTGVPCSKCPLSLTMPIGCEMLGQWILERWPEL